MSNVANLSSQETPEKLSVVLITEIIMPVNSGERIVQKNCCVAQSLVVKRIQVVDK